MPIFFFHLFDDMVSMDEEGKDLPSLEAAHEVAVSNVRDMACAEVLKGSLHLDHRIDVTDRSGEVIDTVCFADVVQVGS